MDSTRESNEQFEKLGSDLKKAVEIMLKRQNLVRVSSEQFHQLQCIVECKNSLTQAPTGSGKTWAAISAQEVLDLLRDQLNHTNIPPQTRVLYIAPPIAIIKTLERELSKFEIKYEILDADHRRQIDLGSKVIIVTPEKLMNTATMLNICKLSWSALVIDEPQYILQWGTSKKKKGGFKRPFREAFQHLNRLNGLGCPFELHTATAQNLG